MKGLYKRGKMYWVAYKAHGKICRESTGVKTKAEAEYFLACRKKQVRDGEIIKAKRLKNTKFVDLTKDYLEWAERQRSYKGKKLLIDQLLKRFGNLNVRDLNTKIIEQWQTERLKRNKPATVNRMMSCLKHMVNKGAQWNMVSEETFKQLRDVKQLEENNKRLRYLTVEECQTLIDCCIDHLKPIVTVALHTGMRLSEILNLKWEMVDLEHSFILLNITKNGERREIPIDKTLIIMFNVLSRSDKSVYVFTDPRTGNPYKSVKKSFSTALKKAGISDFRFHDLRHCFASHLVMNGIDLTSVKELLGHKSLTMTMRYAHLAPGHKRKAVNVLDSVLSAPGKNAEKENLLHSFSSQFEDFEQNQNFNCHKSFHNNDAPLAQPGRATDS